jgi:murein DD-endopeptidase MepM/ murein hydrolase activator NlpD
MYPVKNPVVTASFGVPGSWAAGEHTGTDFAADVGTPVYASWRGTVVYAGGPHDAGSQGSAYGNHVVIRCRTKFGRTRHVLYAHLSGDGVRRGEWVKAGEQIGKTGNTGNTTGPHLHYEERTPSFTYWDYARPVFLDYKPVFRPAVRLSKLRPGVRSLSVRRVKRHLKRKGIGEVVNNRFDENFRGRYARWQRRLGYGGTAANGIPGETSLKKLGFRVRR